MVNLQVVMNGQIIGNLSGSGKRLRLMYDRGATATATFVPLSMSMPATRLRWRGDALSYWLEGLLPDREGVRMRWRGQFGITGRDPESLIEHVGEDVAGAAQFVREDRLDVVLRRLGAIEPVADADIAGISRAARQDILPYSAATRTGRFSLAGAQAKFALQRTPTGWALPSGAEPSTHIFKPAIPGLEDQDVTEVVTMRTAAEIGLNTAWASIVDFDGERVIGVERYDRVHLSGRWWRVHQEDLGQATGTDPKRKYETEGGPGVARCAAVIREHGGELDVQAFARAVIYNYLVRGSDAHARNYSLLITPNDVRLAPLYDLNTTLSFGNQWATHMAMRVGTEDRLDETSVGNWIGFAADLRLDDGWVLDEVASMAASVPDAVATVRGSPDIAGIADKTTRIVQDQAAQWCRTAAKQLKRG